MTDTLIKIIIVSTAANIAMLICIAVLICRKKRISKASDISPYATTPILIISSTDNKILKQNAAAEKLTLSIDGFITDTAVLECISTALDTQIHVEPKVKVNDSFYKILSRVCDKNKVLLEFQNITDYIQTDNARNEFVSNVTHELRTPLTVIRGFAQNLEDNSAAMTEEKKLTYYHNIVAEVDRLSRLVSDILLLSKLDSGVIKTEIEVLDISYCVNVFSEHLSTLCKNKNIKSTINIPVQALAKFEYDRFHQLLMILSENAVKFTPENGNIEIGITDASRFTEIIGGMAFNISNPQINLNDISQTENRLIVYVKDDGIGIDNSKLPHVFERFFTSDKTRGKGTGLGLALTDEILLSIGETAFAAGKSGSGSVIGFTLSKPTDKEISEAC